MGWTGSENMYPNEVRLRFENKKQAITFAKKNKLDFFIKEPIEAKQTIKSYIDNYLK
ncbi:MAG: NADH dehydrogenase ubiquinone Fe-S protein 4 [Candidatus Midichloriaceae bacterium]